MVPAPISRTLWLRLVPINYNLISLRTYAFRCWLLCVHAMNTDHFVLDGQNSARANHCILALVGGVRAGMAIPALIECSTRIRRSRCSGAESWSKSVTSTSRI